LVDTIGRQLVFIPKSYRSNRYLRNKSNPQLSNNKGKVPKQEDSLFN